MTQMLKPGMIISYVLLPHMRPRDPRKLWYGRVLAVYEQTAYSTACVFVELVGDRLYRGNTEFVYPQQLRGVIEVEVEA